MIKKAGFFAEYCLDKSAMSLIKVSGDREGSGFLFVKVTDAIILGGTLIMLPEDMIAEQVTKFNFEGESVDAYGEVANILCGALTQVFGDRYSKKLRFVRTETEVLIPTKLDPESDQPFPAGDYYLASFSIGMAGYELHRMSLLFPAEVFDLYPEQLAATAPGPQVTATAPAAVGTAAPAEDSVTQPATADRITPQAAPTTDQTPQTPIVLLVSERPNDADPFVEILSSSNYRCKVLSYQDDIKALAQQHQVIGIFLIMSQVSEKGFATAIKLQSLSKPTAPLIFVGPDWTRSTVMRAVKYGARDILMLPASSAEIQEKISHHILRAS
jgi:CheY-like chemotaxis protein